MLFKLIKKVNYFDIIALFNYIFAFSLAKIFRFVLPKNIWLISERGDEARDNGYHLFKYIKEFHPEINCYFLIKKKSADFEKVKNYNTVIEYGSFKHYLYYMVSIVCASTHMYRYIPDYRVTQRLDNFFNVNKIRVFLQHGIIKDYHPYLSASRNPLNLFCCGAQKECEYIKQSLGYREDVAICTGLARYDALHDFKIKKQILLMPTWRGDLYLLSDEEFIKSDYYNAINVLLESDILDQALALEDYSLIFYPHYEMQKFLHLFKEKNKRFIIADHDSYDVQQLLKESSILITDYSSVFFDFAFMKKPVIYYQFDKDLYHTRHYEKGYFSYEDDGFGDIVVDNNIIDTLIEYLGRPEMKDKYIKRVDSFFDLNNKCNCEVIFDIIQGKLISNENIKN